MSARRFAMPYSRWRRLVSVLAVAGIAFTMIGIDVVTAGDASAAGTVTYSATQTIPVPPSSSYAGSGGGDGWAVALSSTQVFNVFHHNAQLIVACHLQADATPCWNPVTITDAGGHQFGTSGHPGLYLDQATGKLYVYATRDDNTAGVVCVDTTTSGGASYCGFTSLTPAGDAYTSLQSAVSAPALVGSRWFAFNFVPGAPVSGGAGSENTLLCFDIGTKAACANQPFVLPFAVGGLSGPAWPGIATAAIGTDVVVGANTSVGGQLSCFDTVASAPCSGSGWPTAAPTGYSGSYGQPFELPTAAGGVAGFCLPTGTDQCFDLTGAAISTPIGLPAAAPASDGWNGPGVVLGPRVYVPVGGYDEVFCYDASTGSECANFPRSFPGLSYLYTVNPDPARPTCLWVNADGGTGQIQNFDAYTAGSCGQGPIRVLASSFVVPTVLCQPASYTSLKISQPAPGTYASGTVAFEDGDANPIPGLPTVPLDATGTATLTGLNLSTSTGLPQFLITLVGAQGSPGAVTVTLTWTGANDPSCVNPGTTVSGNRGTVSGHPGWVSDTDALNQGCAQVMFVGLRGSGQKYAATAPAGTEMTSLGNRISRALPTSVSLRRVYVDYLSASVSVIVTQGLGTYLNSLTDGEDRLLKVLLDSQLNCPNEKWIIAGYSQGALAAHQIAPAFPSTNQLAALDLLADPNRAPAGNGTDLGTSRPHDGIYTLLTQGEPLPAVWLNHTFSLCDSRDIICDLGQPLYAGIAGTLVFGGALDSVVAGVLIKNGIDIHTHYATSQPGQTELDTMGVLSASAARRAINGT